MSEDSLDIYIRSLVLEATRLECKKIVIVQGAARPQITFIATDESMEFPHPPKENPEQLVPRLRSLAGLDPNDTGDAQGKGTIKRREENIELALDFSTSGNETTVQIDILSEVAITHL